MNRRHTITEPQLRLPVVAACAYGTARRVHDQLSKPKHIGRRV